MGGSSSLAPSLSLFTESVCRHYSDLTRLHTKFSAFPIFLFSLIKQELQATERRTNRTREKAKSMKKKGFSRSLIPTCPIFPVRLSSRVFWFPLSQSLNEYQIITSNLDRDNISSSFFLACQFLRIPAY